MSDFLEQQDEVQQAALPDGQQAQSVLQEAGQPFAQQLQPTVPICPQRTALAVRRAFTVDKFDWLIAVLFYAIAYLYIEYVLFSAVTHRSYFLIDISGVVGHCLFLGSYVAAVLGYLYGKKITPSRESWLWLAVLLCAGLSLPFYSVAALYQTLLLHAVALYWPMCAGGVLLCGGKTGAGLPFDALNAAVIVPWGNFFSHGRTLLIGVRRTRWGRNLVMVLLGLLLAIPLLFIVVPLLVGADMAFYNMMRAIGKWLDYELTAIAVEMILAVPVSCILFGLVHGVVHRRCTSCFQERPLRAAREKLRMLPTTATATMLCVLSGLYVLFLGLQASYLFDALVGHLPQSFSYSAYAREGFFELCRLGAVNLCVMIGANMLCHTSRRTNRVLRVCNVILCVLSMLLTVTAATKLGMYIAAYGLTVKRVLPLVFVLWMALVFGAAIVWQLRSFSVVRFAVLSLAVLVAVTCAVDVPDLCVLYNEARVRAGTLQASSGFSESDEMSTSYDSYGLLRFRE